MDKISKIYQHFLNDYFIHDFEELKNTLKTYPFYCDFTRIETSCFYQINLTKNSIYERDMEILEIMNNFVVNKDNIKHFFYFGNIMKTVQVENLDNNLNKYEIYLVYDNIKYNLFYCGRWYITSPSYSNIKNLNEKKEFEIYTLYDLFKKTQNRFNINLEKLNKKYNYTFQLTNNDTNLIYNNNFNTSFILSNIIDNTLNKELNIDLYQIKQIGGDLKYNKMINIENKKEMKMLLTNNKYHYLLVKDSDRNYKIDFYNYTVKRKDLDNFISNPIITIINLKMMSRLDNFLINFLQLSIYVKKIDFLLEKLIKYYLDLYKKDKILKLPNLEYKQYDKEVIFKLHGFYLRFKLNVNEKDVLRVFRDLKINKLQLLLYRL